jgi:uncharacterized protein (DUF2344 family)
MTLESIKGNIDRKIESFIKEGLSLEEIAKKLANTKANFEKLLAADVNSSARTHMMTMYCSFAEKRIKDIEFAIKRWTNCYFFAGITEPDLYKLIKLRDKVSQDVLDMEF